MRVLYNTTEQVYVAMDPHAIKQELCCIKILENNIWLPPGQPDVNAMVGPVMPIVHQRIPAPVFDMAGGHQQQSSSIGEEVRAPPCPTWGPKATRTPLT